MRPSAMSSPIVCDIGIRSDEVEDAPRADRSEKLHASQGDETCAPRPTSSQNCSTALGRHDHVAMAACYDEDATFSDIAF